MNDIDETFVEDTHFYIDNALPTEVSQVLRVLSRDIVLSPIEISDKLVDEYGFNMQKDNGYSPRRLYDLGLAKQKRQGQKITYGLTERGLKLQTIQAIDPSLAVDLLHYLHYTSYSGSPHDRKYLWSYRRCCEHIWSNRQLLPSAQLASIMQTEIHTKFPHLDFSAKVGMRFNSTAASCVSTWLRALNPTPLLQSSKTLQMRVIQRFELILLALDDTYRFRQYRYGDSVVMNDSLVDQVSSVFFIDPECCLELLRLSSKISPFIRISDTLSGASVNLLRPYTVDNL